MLNVTTACPNHFAIVGHLSTTKSSHIFPPIFPIRNLLYVLSGLPHMYNMNQTEGKAKVVAAGWGTELIHHAALAI